MFVAEQQLTSLSPRREILCNQNMIARGCAAELSVARSTNASKLARSRCKANALFLRQKNPTFQSGFLPSKERLNHNKTKKQKVTIKVDYILLASICN